MANTDKAIIKQYDHEQDRLVKILHGIVSEHRDLIGTPIPEADRQELEEILADKFNRQFTARSAFDADTAAVWMCCIALHDLSDADGTGKLIEKISNGGKSKIYGSKFIDYWNITSQGWIDDSCSAGNTCDGDCSATDVKYDHPTGTWTAEKHCGWDGDQWDTVEATLRLDQLS